MASIDPTERITTADTQVTNIAGSGNPGHDFHLGNINIRRTCGFSGRCVNTECNRRGTCGAHVTMNGRPVLVHLCGRCNHHTNTGPMTVPDGTSYRRVISRSKQEMQSEEDRCVRNMSLHGNPFGRRNGGLYSEE